jgi:hypothetical protein
MDEHLALISSTLLKIGKKNDSMRNMSKLKNMNEKDLFFRIETRHGGAYARILKNPCVDLGVTESGTRGNEVCPMPGWMIGERSQKLVKC